jgi:glutathione S-transferase
MRPILYSFRRCPYAMRARLGIAASGQEVELREILLRDKAQAFLETSPSGTVPCLAYDGVVLDESLDIMLWALGRHDPEGWLEMPEDGHALIAEADGPFKHALDRTKYATRYPGEDPEAHRADAMAFLDALDGRLRHGFLFGDAPRLADMAILPFVRQFAFIDKPRFDVEAGGHLRGWLEAFLASPLFAGIMSRYPVWTPEDEITIFPLR